MTNSWMPLWLGVRVTRKFRVGFFGFFEIRVLETDTRKTLKKYKTRHFGYSTIRARVRVTPIYRNNSKKGRTQFCIGEEKYSKKASTYALETRTKE